VKATNGRFALVAAALMVAGALPALAGEASAQAVSPSVSRGRAGAFVPLSSSAAPIGPGGTWGEAAAIASPSGQAGWLLSIPSVSCASPGNCSAIAAVGVVDQAGGVWGAPQAVRGLPGSGDGDLISISCASAGNCSAGGFDSSGGEPDAVVVSETQGVWGTAQAVAGMSGLGAVRSAVRSVSCPSPGDCTAAGYYSTSSGSSGETGFVVEETAGVWGQAQVIPGLAGLISGYSYANISVVSCAAAGYCTVGGSYEASAGTEEAFVASETGGAWGDAQEVPGLAALGAVDVSINSLSCPAAGDCTAGGGYQHQGQNGEYPPEAFVADESGGTWGNAQEVPGTAALNSAGHAFTVSVSCPSAGNCAAIGNIWIESAGNTVSSAVFVANETGGSWGNAELVAGLADSRGLENAVVQSLSCGAAGNCSAGGDYFDGTATEAFVVSEADGVWGSGQEVRGVDPGPDSFSEIESVSCAAADYCSAVGYDDDASLAVDEATASATGLAMSPAKVTYGNEQAGHLTAAVTSSAGGTPTGTVTITAGAATVCQITLTAGEGTCAPSARSLQTGSYHLTATYHGDTNYVVSSSAPGVMTVSRAASRTSMTLSKGSVTYGHEHAERISAAVSGQFGGMPAGKVTVRAGSTTICVITLKAGKGSCLLSARQLKAGLRHLKATYGGSTDYSPSASAAKTLRILK
jgi:hypothetical protein